VNRRRVALGLAALVALAGVAPIMVVGAIAIEVLRRRSESGARETLRLVAAQAAARIGAYMTAQHETLRAVAAAVATTPDAPRRLQEVWLDAPSLGRVSLVGPASPASDLPPQLDAMTVARARSGREVSSDVYIADDGTPALDACIPARSRPGFAVCARFDLLELWRFVQRIHVGESGYALAFDRKGRLIASGAGALRGAVLTGESVPQTPMALRAAADLASAPGRYAGPLGEEVLAGWAVVPDTGWAVAVEQPASEALRPALIAQIVLASFAFVGLFSSILVGVRQSQSVLAMLEVEERWKTAGRIAAGITHDLGHRVTILQQTVNLAETGDAAFLPHIRDNLRSEVATLRKFVADFADLSRDVSNAELLPLDLDAFAESVRRSATPHAEKMGVSLAVGRSPGGAWARADRYLLERAVLNLVSNAVEATSRGGEVSLVITTSAATAELAVVDRGHGIEPERMPRLFDAFVSTKRTGAHVGMGLANVKRIVDAHSGRVSAESRLGEGSTFRISLPRIEQPRRSATNPGTMTYRV
jgi:signal transduction histidine kinase